MAIVNYSATSVQYLPEQDSNESVTHAVDFQGDDGFRDLCAAYGLYQRANSNLASEKKGLDWKAAHELISAEMKRMVTAGKLEKEPTEGTKRGQMDTRYLTAIVGAFAEVKFGGDLAKAQAKWTKAESAYGLNTKALRLKFFADKAAEEPELQAVYARLMTEPAEAAPESDDL